MNISEPAESTPQHPLETALAELAGKSTEYFNSLATIEKDPNRPGRLLGSKDVLALRPPQLMHLAEQLQRSSVAFTADYLRALSKSPLSTDADAKQIRILGRQLVSAVELREYRYFDAHSVSDEDTVLGWQPAEQQEILFYTATYSAHLFATTLEKMKSKFVLLVPSSEQAPSRSGSTLVSRDSTFTNPNTAFIMMPIDRDIPDLEDVKECMKNAFKKFGIVAQRADEIEHSDVITTRIINEIRESEFLIADLTLERPSVYYEIGYAHAIQRRVMLFRKRGTRVHFDLAVHNVPEYDNLTHLKELLIKRLEAVTGRKPTL